MTTRKLSELDFMMMDVHRPLLDEEINEVNPQARLDKSARASAIVDGIEASVGAPYPYEVPLPENVTVLPGVTSHDLTAQEILRNAFDANMTEMVICGIDEDGKEHLLRTNADLAPAAFHLQRAMHNLNRMHDSVLLEDGREEA